MLRQELIKIRDWIKLYNPYLVEGFEEVYMDEVTGIVHKDKPIFPADDLGDYFYLRLPNKVQFDNAGPGISDTANNVSLKCPVILVACVKDADPDLLISNLITTMGRYQEVTIRITEAIYQPEYVVAQELAKIKKDNLNAALQRIPEDTAIVSVAFTISKPFVLQQLSCIKTPCIEC